MYKLNKPHVLKGYLESQYCCLFVMVFSKRQRITLRLLYAIAIPSVVCLSVCRLLSVTLVHPTQPVEIFGNFFSPYDSPGTLVF